jgi:hypothetical protein
MKKTLMNGVSKIAKSHNFFWPTLYFLHKNKIYQLFSSELESARKLDDDDIDRNRFERLIQEKMDMPTSDNGLYLARTVAPVLTKALAEVYPSVYFSFKSSILGSPKTSCKSNWLHF